MHTAALELSRHGIRVNALAPGIINTLLSWFVINNPEQSRVFLDRIPIGRFAEPEEMAKPILWMCSDDASYLSGHLMVVDGAMTAGLPEPGEMDAPLPGAIR
jgi:NAD(P)-dependent dehydrogenase (short-subunit alcohol dehydrogenase family)